MSATDRTYWDIHTSDGRCKYPLTCEAEGWHRTTDDTALQEQIAAALSASVGGWNQNTRAIQNSAAAVLPIVRAEVAKARTEAWGEGFEAFEVAYEIDHTDPWRHLRDNPYRTEQTDGR